MLADPVSELDRAWVIAALAEKLKDQPSEAHIQRLRELYRSPHADRDRLTDIIARMQEQVRFEPIFLTDPKQPQMICAIDHNPMIVFEQGKLRPGDWLNIDDITGYIKEIHFDRMIVHLNGTNEEFRFNFPVIFGHTIRSRAKISIFPGNMNLRTVTEAICEVEGINAYLGDMNGFITGAFSFDDYQTFLRYLVEHLEGDFDGETLVHYPNEKPIIIIKTPNLIWEDVYLSEFFNTLSELSGYQFEYPDYPSTKFGFYLVNFDSESLFESLEWTYTYDHQSKTVRAKERER